jgi:phenylacetate-CoA ligase
MIGIIRKFLFIVFRYKVYKCYQFYEKSQWWDRKTLEEYQLRKLKEILKYAYKYVPFYKELWDECGVDYRISSLEDLKKFPITTKEMLQKAIQENKISVEYIDKLNTNKIVWQSTTGSSGKPFKFPVDIESENHKNGLRRRLYRWYGIDYGTKWVKFWRGKYKKSLKEKIKEFLTGQYRFCIYDPDYPEETKLTENRIKYFITELNKLKPEVIDGFPSALREIGNYILENDIHLDFKLKAIVTGAEKLDDTTRNILSSAFNCLVFNRYGGTESSIIAHECEVQAKTNHKLHIQEDRLIIETNENNEIIFTDLTSKALPFIRYKNGDIGKINENYKCSCGRVFKVFDYIEGRVNEMFILPDGGKLSSHLWQNYMKKCQGIKKYQMIQNEDYSVVIFWVKNDLLFNEKEFKKVQNLIKKALQGCNVKWYRVDNIYPQKGGKFIQHICKVKK